MATEQQTEEWRGYVFASLNSTLSIGAEFKWIGTIVCLRPKSV